MITNLIGFVFRKRNRLNFRANSIDINSCGNPHTIQGEVGIVAGGVLQGGPVVHDGTTHGNSIGIGIVLAHGVAKHQGASARAAAEGGLNSAPHIQGDPYVGGASSHGNHLGKVHGKVEVLPDDVGTIGGHTHRGYGWPNSIDFYICGAPNVVEGKVGSIASGI